MIKVNYIYNEDCRDTIKRMIDENFCVDYIITSPFYNTTRSSKCHNKRLETHEGKYDVHLDDMDNDEYISFTTELFNSFNKIVNENGCVLYNLNYGAENTEAMWLVISAIILNTNWTVADDIIWKKKSALPNNTSNNKLTRICEHILVFCRKNEFKTFKCNKKIKSISKVGQKYYHNVYNFIEANNNDGVCKFNKATYSSDLINQLIDIYVIDGSIVYDPFIGTGTTAISCIKNNIKFIGSEISKNQVEFSIERIKKIL